MKAITLEEILAVEDLPDVCDGLRCAIRERDELRVEVARLNDVFARANHRTSVAEAELAALRKRVDNAPTGTLLVNYSHGQPISANIAADNGEALAAIDQCSVRLVVDDA